MITANLKKNTESIFEDGLNIKMEMNTTSSKSFDIVSNRIYKNKKESIIRELIANGIDACVAINSIEPIIVHYPEFKNIDGKIDDLFFIQDFGIGMTKEIFQNVFCNYFTSTKENNKDLIGGYGLGGKTPFMYTDIFFIETTSPEDKIRRTFELSLINGIAAFNHIKIYDIPNSEIMGTKISFKLKSEEDIKPFYAPLIKYLASSHKIKSNIYLSLEDYEIKYTNGYQYILFDEVLAYYNHTLNQLFNFKLYSYKYYSFNDESSYDNIDICYNNYIYKLSVNNLEIDRKLLNNYYKSFILFNKIKNDNNKDELASDILYIDNKKVALELTVSRENISKTDSNNEIISNCLMESIKFKTRKLKDEIKNYNFISESNFIKDYFKLMSLINISEILNINTDKFYEILNIEIEKFFSKNKLYKGDTLIEKDEIIDKFDVLFDIYNLKNFYNYSMRLSSFKSLLISTKIYKEIKCNIKSLLKSNVFKNVLITNDMKIDNLILIITDEDSSKHYNSFSLDNYFLDNKDAMDYFYRGLSKKFQKVKLFDKLEFNLYTKQKNFYINDYDFIDKNDINYKFIHDMVNNYKKNFNQLFENLVSKDNFSNLNYSRFFEMNKIEDAIILSSVNILHYSRCPHFIKAKVSYLKNSDDLIEVIDSIIEGYTNLLYKSSAQISSYNFYSPFLFDRLDRNMILNFINNKVLTTKIKEEYQKSVFDCLKKINPNLIELSYEELELESQSLYNHSQNIYSVYYYLIYFLFIKYSVLQNNLNGLNDENFMSEFLKKYEFDNIIFKSFISPNSFYDYLYDKSKLFLNYDEVVKVELFDSKFLNYYIYQQE